MSTQWRTDIRDIRLQIALSLIAASGRDAVSTAEEIAVAVEAISRVVAEEETP